MNHYPHPILAREGWPFIGLALVLSLLATVLWGGVAAIPFYIVLVFVLQFFRDPPRPVPELANAVLSPADGRIVKIEKVRDPYADRDALLISVFMNVFNCHVNRVPVSGTIDRIAYRPGLFLNADLDKASEDNERNALIIDTGAHRFGVVQIAGLIARRIVSFVDEGDTLNVGERFGLIRFGSRVDVYLPEGVHPLVGVGQTAIAGETVIARIGGDAPKTSFNTI